jgi:hypothetical protein
MSLKTENSRRVAKSRPVCMGLYACTIRTRFSRDEFVHATILRRLPTDLYKANAPAMKQVYASFASLIFAARKKTAWQIVRK